MRPYDLYVFDLDGTLYRGEEAVPQAVEAVARVKARGAKVAYLTNNSSQTRQAFAEKLTRLGFEASVDEIESSATGTAAYLAEQGMRSAHVVGEAGLVETLRGAGIDACGQDEPWDEPADVVVCGICRTLTYELLARGLDSIRAGARFVATNADPTYPMEGGRVIPGAGSIVAALRTASGIEPFVVGKPKPFLTQLVMAKAGIDAKDTLVVGDRMDTDIESGIAAGCDTLLVLTGVTHEPPPGQTWAADLSTL